MTSTTQLTTINATVAPEWYGDYAAHFDVEAINREYCKALDTAAKAIVPTVSVTASGIVYVDVNDLDAAREINWTELAEGIDVEAIANRHELTTTIDPTTTTIALVDDTTDETLEYGDYRGWVGLNAHGEWVENLTPEQVDSLTVDWDATNVEYTRIGAVKAVQR